MRIQGDMMKLTTALFAVALLLVTQSAFALPADAPPSELMDHLIGNWGQWNIVVGCAVALGIYIWRLYEPQVFDQLHPSLKRLLPPTIAVLSTTVATLINGGSWAEFGRVFIVTWTGVVLTQETLTMAHKPSKTGRENQ
jgi:hypothetical protein